MATVSLALFTQPMMLNKENAFVEMVFLSLEEYVKINAQIPTKYSLN